MTKAPSEKGAFVIGSPAWTRTKNLPVNSRLLCQLSYRGMRPLRGQLDKLSKLPT